MQIEAKKLIDISKQYKKEPITAQRRAKNWRLVKVITKIGKTDKKQVRWLDLETSKKLMNTETSPIGWDYIIDRLK